MRVDDEGSPATPASGALVHYEAAVTPYGGGDLGGVLRLGVGLGDGGRDRAVRVRHAEDVIWPRPRRVGRIAVLVRQVVRRRPRPAADGDDRREAAALGLVACRDHPRECVHELPQGDVVEIATDLQVERDDGHLDAELDGLVGNVAVTTLARADADG
eukprot:6565857-Prymnesium_polylepis.1